MQGYDVALRLLLQGSATLAVQELIGAPIAKWLDVELPKIQNLRLDLLGQTADGGLVHVELQSAHDATMPLRMAEYCLGVFRLFGQFPRQVVLYVGEQPLRMKGELRAADFFIRYQLIDIRALDGDLLLQSEAIGDNIIAILAHLRDHKEAVHQGRRANCDPGSGGAGKCSGAVDDSGRIAPLGEHNKGRGKTNADRLGHSGSRGAWTYVLRGGAKSRIEDASPRDGKAIWPDPSVG